MRIRLKHFSVDMAITLMAGGASLVVNTFLAYAGAYRSTSTGPAGFPFPIRYVDPTQFGPGGLIYRFDLLQLVLDGAFWTLLTFAIVTFTDWITAFLASRALPSPQNKSPRSTLGL